MNYWRKFPFIRILIPFILGIIIAIFSDTEFHIPLFIFVFLFVIILSSIFLLEKFISFKFRWIYGFLLSILLFLLGFELCIQNTEKFFENNILPNNNGKQKIICEILEPASENEKS